MNGKPLSLFDYEAGNTKDFNTAKIPGHKLEVGTGDIDIYVATTPFVCHTVPIIDLPPSS